VNTVPGVVFSTLQFHHKLWICQIRYRFWPLKAFPALCKQSSLMGPFLSHKKWCVANIAPGEGIKSVPTYLKLLISSLLQLLTKNLQQNSVYSVLTQASLRVYAMLPMESSFTILTYPIITVRRLQIKIDESRSHVERNRSKSLNGETWTGRTTCLISSWKKRISMEGIRAHAIEILVALSTTTEREIEHGQTSANRTKPGPSFQF